jgi:Na+-driven multidrug efflux pump
MNQDFLKENITKSILNNALPALGGLILLVIDSFLDGIIVSRMIGQKALGGLTLLTPLLIFQTSLGSLVASGASILISKSVGKNDELNIRIIFFNQHLVALALSILAFGLYLFLGDWILHRLSSDEMEIAFAHSFYKVFLAGSIIVILSMSYGALMRSFGQFRNMSLFLLASILTNVVLSLVLIPIFGMAGCATAILISMFLYGMLNLFSIWRIYYRVIEFTVDFEIINQILSIGFSAFLFQFSNIFRQAIILKFINLQGNNDLALYGVISRILALLVIPTQALMQSFQPLYIANLAANLKERCIESIQVVRNYGILMAIVFCGLGMIFTENVLSAFFKGNILNPASLEAFRIALLLIIFYPIASLSFVLLQSSGNHKMATILVASREVLLLLPLMFLFSQFVVTNTVYWAILLEVAIYTTIIYGVTRFKTGFMVEKPLTPSQLWTSKQ